MLQYIFLLMSEQILSCADMCLIGSGNTENVHCDKRQCDYCDGGNNIISPSTVQSLFRALIK